MQSEIVSHFCSKSDWNDQTCMTGSESSKTSIFQNCCKLSSLCPRSENQVMELTFTPLLVYISFPFCSTLARIICLKPAPQILFHSYRLTNSISVSPAQMKNLIFFMRTCISEHFVTALLRVYKQPESLALLWSRLDWVRLIQEWLAKNIEFQCVDWVTACLI